ncbi:MAG: class I SAM-dependent methyltransferase [Hyphomicrobiaceae bacterium]|nr:class I SAM-dependent methyltransferase [Hyphomicrobiaceae bacterium]
MKKHIKSLYKRLISPLATKADINNLYVQLSSLQEIREIVGPGVPIGPLRGWALSPDALLMLLRDITARTSPRVMEFGSGESTIAIAAALRALGAGSLISIEHDANFSARIAMRLRQLDLETLVDLRVLPLCSHEPRLGLPAFNSYDLKGLADDFDVVLIDGPIVYFGVATRSIPLEWCISRMGPGKTVYLDDAARPEETAVIEAIRISHPQLNIEFIETEKGLCKLTMPQLGSSAASMMMPREAIH